MLVCSWACMCHGEHVAVRGQLAGISPLFAYVGLRDELMLSGLAASAFAHWATPPALPLPFELGSHPISQDDGLQLSKWPRLVSNSWQPSSQSPGDWDYRCKPLYPVKVMFIQDYSLSPPLGLGIKPRTSFVPGKHCIHNPHVGLSTNHHKTSQPSDSRTLIAL